MPEHKRRTLAEYRRAALEAVHRYVSEPTLENELRLSEAVKSHDDEAFRLMLGGEVAALRVELEAILGDANMGLISNSDGVGVIHFSNSADASDDEFHDAPHQHGAGVLAHGTHEERKALVHAAGHELKQATRRFLKRAVLSPVESLLAKAHPYEQLLAKEVAGAPAHLFHKAWKKLAKHYGDLDDSQVGGSFFSHAFHKLRHGSRKNFAAIGKELKHDSRKAFEFAKSPFEIAANLNRAAVKGSRQLADSKDVIGDAQRAADVAKTVADVAASVETGGASAVTP